MCTALTTVRSHDYFLGSRSSTSTRVFASDRHGPTTKHTCHPPFVATKVSPSLPPSSSSASSSLDLSVLAEVEMARLGRQHRVTVVQRKALNTSSENELRKQKVQLEKLQKDNDTFKEQLRLAEMDFKAEQATGDYVRELRARYAGYEAEIEAELERSGELDSEINEATRILDTERTALGKSQSLIRSPESYQRQIATMENRLEKALNGYDVYLTKNSGLRQTIDHLKKERNTFGGLKKRLELELLEQKKSIAEIIDSSNAAYEARDDAQARMTALRERSEKEMQESTMELKELNRVLEQERKLKEFMGVKGRDRAKVSRGILPSPFSPCRVGQPLHQNSVCVCV